VMDDPHPRCIASLVLNTVASAHTILSLPETGAPARIITIAKGQYTDGP
jgi:hypothetical protein